MIIETKRWQVAMFIFGLLCLFFSIEEILNFNAINVNICLHPGSQFFYYLNQGILFLTLLLLGVIGVAFLYSVFYSIKKCREFREYETKPVNYKKIGLIVSMNIIIIALLFTSIFLWDKTLGKKINEKRKNAYYALNPLTQTIVTLKMRVLSYTPKDSYTEGPKWENVLGISSGVIEAPKEYKGGSIKVKVLSNGGALAEKLQKRGNIVSFRIISNDGSRRTLRSNRDIRDVINSNSYLTSSRLLFSK